MTPINFHQSSQALSPWCILTSEINTFCTRLTVIKAATSKATNGFVGAIKGRVEAGVDTVGMWTKRIIIENVLFLMAFPRLPARVRKSLASAWFTQRKLIKISPSRVSDETMERKKKHRKNAAFNLIICINRGMKLLMKLKKFFVSAFTRWHQQQHGPVRKLISLKLIFYIHLLPALNHSKRKVEVQRC